MSSLVYDGSNHKITLFDRHGLSLGEWTAYNNIDHAFSKKHYQSHRHLLNGLYSVIDTTAPHHHTPDPNGPYGSHGIIRFNYPHHSGVGLHSGRAHSKHKPGPQHATHGCIRTTDKAMAAISAAIKEDPLASITVKGNSAVTADHGKMLHSTTI